MSENRSQPVVRRAEAFLRSNLGERVTIRDLCREMGVSARVLHLEFIKHVGAPPMRYLKMMRLCGARDDLRSAPPGTLVTDIAMRWGFCHFGRFASDYLRCFGERPSATLEERRLAIKEREALHASGAVGMTLPPSAAWLRPTLKTMSRQV